jgi:hypothetical protein
MTVGGENTARQAHSPQLHQGQRRLPERDPVARSSLRSTIAPTNPAQMLDTGINLAKCSATARRSPVDGGGNRRHDRCRHGCDSSPMSCCTSMRSDAMPDSVKPNEKLSVTVKRRGVVLRAPTRIRVK